MNVLVLGNGFDLNYHLPTKYVSFLHTVQYLATTSLFDIKTTGDIFGAEKLQAMDKDICESYKKYNHEYNSVKLDYDVVTRLSDLYHNNVWFSYLLQSFNKDIGWIDFEKEIGIVLKSFQAFLSRDSVKFDFSKHPESKIDRYILSKFNFFFREMGSGSIPPSLCKANSEYTVTYPFGSTIEVLDKEKIIGTLENQLSDLAEGLKLYLQQFVEKTAAELIKSGKLEKSLMFQGTNHAVTFNYTNTFEKVYGVNSVFHIHGNVNDSIILGINPDTSDDGVSIDTSFLRFKKYYQRVVTCSDVAYLNWIENLQRAKNDVISLLVMGHSLDVTDKDIITELFDLADDITVLYWNDSAKVSLITNLVGIFGREKLHELRTKKKLTFMSQNSDFTDFASRKMSTSKSSLERWAEFISSEPDII